MISWPTSYPLTSSRRSSTRRGAGLDAGLGEVAGLGLGELGGLLGAEGDLEGAVAVALGRLHLHDPQRRDPDHGDGHDAVVRRPTPGSCRPSRRRLPLLPWRLRLPSSAFTRTLRSGGPGGARSGLCSWFPPAAQAGADVDSVRAAARWGPSGRRGARATPVGAGGRRAPPRAANESGRAPPRARRCCGVYAGPRWPCVVDRGAGSCGAPTRRPKGRSTSPSAPSTAATATTTSPSTTDGHDRGPGRRRPTATAAADRPRLTGTLTAPGGSPRWLGPAPSPTYAVEVEDGMAPSTRPVRRRRRRQILAVPRGLDAAGRPVSLQRVDRGAIVPCVLATPATTDRLLRALPTNGIYSLPPAAAVP